VWSSGDGGWVGYPDVAAEGVEQGGELVAAVLGGGGEVAGDPVSVDGSGEAGEPAGDLLLDLRWSKAAFGVVRSGWDGQVVDEPQDVARPVAEDFQQVAGLDLPWAVNLHLDYGVGLSRSGSGAGQVVDEGAGAAGGAWGGAGDVGGAGGAVVADGAVA
jgi:hypothetical protein